ncbi:MAG: DoxX family protein [Anaerolineales bacterium]|nr:DoxX family protein [Anaerolineales bacterium]
MQAIFSSLSPDWGLLILRLGVAIVFFAHGLPKIKNVGNIAGFFKQAGIPLAGLSAWVVSLLETFGPILLVLGLGTRVVGLGMAIAMLVAIVAVRIRMAKVGFAGQGGQGGWEFEFILGVAALALVFTGAGAVSLDAGLGW